MPRTKSLADLWIEKLRSLPNQELICVLDLVPNAYDSRTVESFARNISKNPHYILDVEFEPRPPRVYISSIDGFFSPDLEEILSQLVPSLHPVSSIYIYKHACSLKSASLDYSELIHEDGSSELATYLIEFCSQWWPDINLEIIEY